MELDEIVRILKWRRSVKFWIWYLCNVSFN